MMEPESPTKDLTRPRASPRWCGKLRAILCPGRERTQEGTRYTCGSVGVGAGDSGKRGGTRRDHRHVCDEHLLALQQGEQAERPVRRAPVRGRRQREVHRQPASNPDDPTQQHDKRRPHRVLQQADVNADGGGEVGESAEHVELRLVEGELRLEVLRVDGEDVRQPAHARVGRLVVAAGGVGRRGASSAGGRPAYPPMLSTRTAAATIIQRLMHGMMANEVGCPYSPSRAHHPHPPHPARRRKNPRRTKQGYHAQSRSQ